MSDVVISVEGLGKKYRIRHQHERQRYVALRDVLTHKVKTGVRGLWSAIRHPRFQLSAFNSQLSASAEDFWALRDVSFSVRRGEVIGIIGRNGAGKSTLLKILSQITEPTEGRVRVKGRVASLLEVGTGFHPELTGRENIYLNGAILGMRREEIKRKFDEIVAFSEVEKFLDTPVKHYSSGMYVRLAFAVASHLEPEILVVDEVLAVGDAQFQKKCLGKMGEVAKGGRTVLFVSHNMGTVSSLCQNAIWLQAGSIRRIAPAREAINEYLKLGPQATNQTLNLAQVPRSAYLDPRLRLERIEWLTQLPFRHGETLKARICFRTNSSVADVTVGIGFSTIEGARLLTYETDFQDGSRPTLNHAGSYSVEVETDSLPLAPGFYSIAVGCRSGDSYALDYLPGVAQLEVIPGPKTPGYIVRMGAGVRLESNWTWASERDDFVEGLVARTK